MLEIYCRNIFLWYTPDMGVEQKGKEMPPELSERLKIMKREYNASVYGLDSTEVKLEHDLSTVYDSQTQDQIREDAIRAAGAIGLFRIKMNDILFLRAMYELGIKPDKIISVLDRVDELTQMFRDELSGQGPSDHGQEVRV